MDSAFVRVDYIIVITTTTIITTIITIIIIAIIIIDIRVNQVQVQEKQACNVRPSRVPGMAIQISYIYVCVCVCMRLDKNGENTWCRSFTLGICLIGF